MGSSYSMYLNEGLRFGNGFLSYRDNDATYSITEGYFRTENWLFYFKRSLDAYLVEKVFAGKFFNHG